MKGGGGGGGSTTRREMMMMRGGFALVVVVPSDVPYKSNALLCLQRKLTVRHLEPRRSDKRTPKKKTIGPAKNKLALALCSATH
eukprot:6662463-Pyramimonas_sp.AAC.1